MLKDKIERILQVDALQGLPMASEIHIFPVIPDTDSFLLVPKNDDCGNKDDCAVVDNYHQDEGDIDGPITTSNGEHTRRFTTGNITIPYTKVKILSQYLAALTGSCHNYCKYGASKEGGEDVHEETHNNTSTLKRFNDTLGKGHRDMLKQAATTLMEIRSKMAVSQNITPANTKTPSTYFSSPKLNPLRDATTNKKGSTITSEIVLSPNPQRSDHSCYKKGTNNNPSRLKSSSTSQLGVFGSPKSYTCRKMVVSPSVKSRILLTKLGTPSYTSQVVGSPKHQKSRGSMSVSKVETSSSATNKLPILSKIFSTSSSLSTSFVSSCHYPKPQKVEPFVSPFHRRAASMSKSSLFSPSLTGAEDSKISLPTQHRVESRRPKSQLANIISAREEIRERRSKKLEASVCSLSVGSSFSNRKTTGSPRTRSSVEKETVSSPAKPKFLRRRSISELLKSPTKNFTRLNCEKSMNRKATPYPKEDQGTSNDTNVDKQNEIKKLKNEQVESQIRTYVSVNETNINTSMEATPITNKRGSIVASATKKPQASENNITQLSTLSIRKKKMLQRPTHHVHGSSSPLILDNYKTLRCSTPRSVISEPIARSKDCHSVISSIESCETDLVMEQKAMERVISLGTSSSASTKRTRRGSILNVGNHHNNIDEQPRKLKFRPCRVIEFKPEITSPRRLKFKRRAPRNDSSWSKVYTNFGVLREGCVRREEINRRVAFADVVDYKKVVLRHQDMQADKVLLQASINNMIEEIVSKLVEDKKSKVKALVGAFESLNTLHDSKVIPTLTV